MTWNIRSLRDDRATVVTALRQFAPDVLFVQEVPRFWRVRSRLAALARESGLVVATGGSPAPGVAILTSLRVDVDATRQVALPHTDGLHRRGAAVTRMSLLGRRWSAVSVHLGLDHAERLRHAAAVRDLAELTQVPDTVIAGDLNETETGSAWRLLGSGLTDAGAATVQPTFPARSPQKRIDTIFVPDHWRTRTVSPHEMVDESLLVRATDHRPVVVDVVD